MAKGRYVKGTVQQVIRADAAGFPLDAIERDPDGQLWHVKEGDEPVAINDDDARTVAAEAENKG